MNVITPFMRRVRERLRAEDGFTMLIALGTLAVTALIATAAYVAVNGDINSGNHDLQGKRAYYAASAGVNDYLYQLNEQPDYWKTCSPNDTQGLTGVPGATATGVQYSFNYLLANGSTSCSSTDPITSLIDKNSGTLQMKFIGYSGTTGNNNANCQGYTTCRGIIASFRKDSPIDFLWYTVYESFDPSILGYNDCAVFYRNGKPAHCDIFWVTGDVINGPMYTQDQYLIGSSPVFGRNTNDQIESVAPGTNSSAICASNSCGIMVMKGKPVWGARTISPPADNSQLLTDAQNHGKVYSGTTTINVNGSVASVTNCPGTSASSSCTTSSVDVTQFPIIYVQNANGCTPPAYSPYNISYPTTTSGGNFYGCSGDVYVKGYYNSSLTIAAANNIIVDGNLTTDHDSSGQPTGTAAMGLVANEFVRVMHGMTPARQNPSIQQCLGTNGTLTSDVPSQTFNNLTVDAAILAIQHSWIVDNFDCGTRYGNLTVNGAIAQYYRGPVGTTGTTGYLKNYTYDDRFKVILPPYLFDIANSGWHVVRETLCVPGGTGTTGC
jgi:hypothetical protein